MSLLSTPFDPAREAALVTGAGNGIGRAIAQGLVGEGMRTVFADVNRDTVTAAVNASARPELAVPFNPDKATGYGFVYDRSPISGGSNQFVSDNPPSTTIAAPVT